MAENGQDISDQLKNIAGSRPSSAAKEDTKARLKSVKERENEERQKKLEELKAQALAAQRFKEKKEMERRQRIDEMKQKEDIRRQQVEERKKVMNDAERDRLEAIIRRNQEREARIEAKKRNERHSMVFAFGSSTPRMLQPTDSIGSFWGHRRATSTQNITCTAAPLTRRQSERELDGGSKKRATSAGGLERSVEDMRMSSSMYEIMNWEKGHNPDQQLSSPPIHTAESTTPNFGATSPQVPAGCASGYVGRRRTDLMPTIPTRESPSAPPRKSFTRSPAPSRPSSSLSQQSTSSVTSSVTMRSRPVAAPRRPRPISIAVTGISTDLKNGSPSKSEQKPPLPKTRKSSLVKSTEKLKKRSIVGSPTDGSPKLLASPTQPPPNPVESKESKTVVKETKVVKEAKNEGNIIEQTTTTTTTVTNTEVTSNVEPTVETSTEQVVNQLIDLSISTNNEPQEIVDKPTEEPIIAAPALVPIPAPELVPSPALVETAKEQVEEVVTDSAPIVKEIPEPAEPVKEVKIIQKPEPKPEEPKIENGSSNSGEFNELSTEMTTSMTKTRISTEEEAKAALAERRRLAREEAERQAEMERLRIEEEERLERERQQREEEQQRILIEKLRQEEQQRLEEAIKEAQKREEEEKLRREEENRMKVLKEEAERRAREEAERQKAELAERLKNEEKEREARRKRVEAIMLRTRGKNNSSTPQQTDEKNEENKSEKLNGSNVDDNPKNGHKNGKDIETVDNIIPVETLKNANTVNNVDNLSTDDTLNSNNAWQHNSQTDLLM